MAGAADGHELGRGQSVRPPLRTDAWTNNGEPWTFIDWGGLAGPGPEWARTLVRTLNSWLDLFEWWAIHRQTAEGDIGGGWTDDVEIVPAFALTSFVLEDASHLSTQAALQFADGLWNSSTMDRARGYQAQYGDVEHTAEPSGYGLTIYPMLRQGDPEGLERILKSAQTFASLFLTNTPSGHVHFKGNYMSATQIALDSNHRADIPLNGRVTLPFNFLVSYSGNPGLEGPLRAWAEAWADDAARTEKGKPAGVFPNSVWVPTDEIGSPATRPTGGATTRRTDSSRRSRITISTSTRRRPCSICARATRGSRHPSTRCKPTRWPGAPQAGPRSALHRRPARRPSGPAANWRGRRPS